VLGDKVLGDKITIYEAQPLPPAETKERRDLGILLKNVETTWIKGVLENSVHDAVWLDLGKEKRADAVEHPWQMMLEVPGQTRQTLPPETKIKDIFEEANRLLLILGEPGSGKTTTLLQLARNLIDEVKQDSTFVQPVPVIFNLSTWTDKQQPLEDWLSAELSNKYRVPKKDGRRWLEEKRILPLLDGLDEVKAENRIACVEKINRLSVDYGLQGVVVCSRIKDYTALDVRLELNRAIYLQPLTSDQIAGYFERVGDKLAGLWVTLQQDEVLQSLIQSPLMLNIMSLAYQDTSPDELSEPGLVTVEARRQHLFDTYIARMFKRKGEGQLYDVEQTKQRISWLARKMQQHNQEVFLIEGLQPSWLQHRRWRLVYVLASRLLGGLIVGLSFGLSFGLIVGLLGLSAGLSAGLFAGLLVGFIDILRFEGLGNRIKVKTPSELWWSIINVVVVGLSVVLIFGLSVVLFFGLIVGLFIGLIVGLIFGLIVGLIFGLRGSRQSPTNDIRTVETLHWFWRKALKGGLVVGLIVGLSFGLIVELSVGLLGLSAGLSVGLFFRLLGLIVGLSAGLIGAVFSGLSREIIETKTVPNQGIRLSARNAIFGGLIVGLLAGLSAGLIVGLSAGLIVSLSAGLIAGLNAGALGALWYGGLDIIQHYTLRLILIIQGHTPRNYARFLDNSVNLIFLQRVGGGYRFIHRVLLEHFAAMGPSEGGE